MLELHKMCVQVVKLDKSVSFIAAVLLRLFWNIREK